MEPVAAAVWDSTARRLTQRWRTVAERVRPYNEGASQAYLQAAEDLEREITQHGAHVDALSALQTSICARLVEVIDARYRRETSESG